ncbi:MAG: SAM-dependent methyltransferase [Leptolyngbya foveolarum]|uniref:SAM-dependent methyltransferase n=1 Tax=Leptolyngbya foveolarum TaxID=47253 RepID=A0A2W4UL95_9CYAN|nr:MAG: SAM-dependent methyltransferase [Leptolyngbya foveolarum]
MIARLSSESSILEIGCGPGNATVAFAQLGYAMTCLDPNQEFCELVRSNCMDYPKVEVHQTSFEQWNPDIVKPYDAVLAANAFHWIAPEVKYAKAFEMLKEDGHLVLLWNLTPEPDYEVYKHLEAVYAEHAPSLVRYEGKAVQAEILEKFEQETLDSGYFEKPVIAQTTSTVTYTVDDFLILLSTLRRIEPKKKEALFRGVRERLSERITLSFLSEVQVARRI